MSFLRPVDIPQTILLEECPPDHAERYMKIVEGLTRARLTEIAKMYIPLAATGQLSFGPKHFNYTQTLNEWLTDRYRGYVDLQRSVAVYLLHEPNLRRAIEAWPANFRSVIAYALNNFFIGIDKIREIISENPVKIVLRSGRETFVTPDMITSTMNTDISGQVNIYNMIPQVGRLVGKIMGLDGYNRISATTDVLPEFGIEAFTGEGDIIGKMPVFMKIADAEHMQLTPGGCGVKAGDANTLDTALGLADPFSDSKIKYLKRFRIKAVALVLFTARAARSHISKKDAAYDTPDLIKLGIANLHTLFLENAALPYFDKIPKSILANVNGSDIILAISKILTKYSAKRLAEGKSDVWVNADNLVDEVFVGLNMPDKFGIDLSELRYNSLYNNLAVGKMQLVNVVPGFSKQLLRGIIAMLASVGLVELAYSPSALTGARPFEAIRFVRLTGLGRYVFDVDDVYTPQAKAQQVEPSIELDSDNFIVKILKDDAMNFIKNNIGKKISSNRYLVDNATLSRKISTPAELEGRISILKELAGITELPTSWQALADNISRRLTALKAMSLRQYRMYALNGRRTDLIEFLRSDPEARKLILMVEGGRFLVKNEDITSLRSLLAEKGFILPEPFADAEYWFYR